MLRTLARFWAKRRYIWHQELESATNDSQGRDPVNHGAG